MDRDRSYRAEGIVLRRRNLGEADSVFTVFSEELGKFEAVARGIRKARSRMRGHVETLVHARFLLARGRTFDVFTQAEAVETHRHLRDDLDRLGAAQYCCELVDRFTGDHEPHAGLFDLLAGALAALDAGAPLHLVRAFELRLMALTGYELQLDACAACDSRLPAVAALFAPSGGGLLCQDCRPGVAGRLLSVRAIKGMRFLREAPLADVVALRVDEALDSELRNALGDGIRYFLDREPGLAGYLGAVARLPVPVPSQNARP